MNEREVDLTELLGEDPELNLEDAVKLESGPSSIRAVGSRLWTLS